MESGGSGVAQPSSDTTEGDLTIKEIGTSETEPSNMEISATEPTKAESSDAEPNKATRKTAKGGRRRRRRPAKFPSFAIYFSRVLRQVHPGLSLSRVTVNLMDSFVKDMFEQIAEEAGRLVRSRKQRTMTPEDILTAVHLLLLREICMYATFAATRSLTRFHSCR